MIPEKHEEHARLGSVVRVPLRGRRVRGWIVGLEDKGEPEGIEPIAAVSGRGPVFDEPMLEASRTLSRRYVQPLSLFFRLMTPPRLGRPRKTTRNPPTPEPSNPAPNLPPSLPENVSRGSFAVWRLAPGQNATARYADLIRSIGEDASAIVVVPEIIEGSQILNELQTLFGDEAALVHSEQDPKERSEALWSAAEGRARVILGSRAAVFAQARNLAAIIVHSEDDGSLKEQRAPYYDARVVATARSESSGCKVVLSSETPSLYSLSSADGSNVVEPDRPQERGIWPVVETVDPPKVGMPRRAIASILETKRRGDRALVLLPRSQATRSGPGAEQVVRFVNRIVPEASVERADRPGLGERTLSEVLEADVVVATEAALAEIHRPKISTAIALGVDSFLARPTYKAAEECFRILWRLGGLIARPERAGRMIVETSDPGHHVIQAVVRGSYGHFVSQETGARKATESPPFFSFVRLRTNSFSEEMLEQLRGLPKSELLGPAPGARGEELLIKTPDLEPILDPLRRMVSKNEQRISVEVDPRDV